MELRVVQTFVCACELNSFTKTAEKLGYTQSTITIQMHQLEEELGTKLFDRIGKKIIPTEKGLKFYEYANEMIQLELKAKQVLVDDMKPYGELRIGITESLLDAYFYKIIPEFREKYPDVFLNIRVECSDELIYKLKQNEYDLIMLVGEEVQDKDCETMITWQEDGVFVASADHILSRDTDIPLEKVMSQPMILSDTKSVFREVLDRIAQNHNIRINTSLQVNDSRVLMDLVEKNLGITFVPKYIAERKIEKGTVVPLSVENFNRMYHVQILSNKKKWCCLPMISMLEILKKRMPGKKSSGEWTNYPI